MLDTTSAPLATIPDELSMIDDMFDPTSNTHFTKCDDTVLISAPNGTTIPAKVIEAVWGEKKIADIRILLLKKQLGLHSTVRYWL